MKQLDLEKGEVDLEGKVDSLTYLSKIQITGMNPYLEGCSGER
mgnify:CR=1 FL=1